MKKHPLILPLATAAGLLAFVGCSSNSARYVDAEGSRTVVNVDRINIQDFSMAAEEMVASLLSSGAVNNAPRTPAVMAVSGIVNNTTQMINTDLLVKKIRIALNQSGKVETSTTLGAGGRAEDNVAASTGEYRDFMEDKKNATLSKLPDFTLSGKIIEDRTRAGDIRQSAYIFQLSLTDTRSGTAKWEDEKTIVKQGEKASVGW